MTSKFERKQKSLVLAEREIMFPDSYIYTFACIFQYLPWLDIESFISVTKLRLWLKVPNFIECLWKKNPTRHGGY